MLNLVLTIVLALGANDPIDEALAILADRAASTQAIKAACKTIEKSVPDDDKACITSLLSIWEALGDGQYEGRRRAIRLACSKAGDASVSVILARVESMLNSKNAETASRASTFCRLAGIGSRGTCPAVLLSRKLKNPEPLLGMLARHGWWNTILNLECAQELKERYLITSLRHPDPPEESRSGGAYIICSVSDGAMAELRRLVRELRMEKSPPAGFDTALLALVQWEDQEIIGDLESITNDPRLTQARRDAANTYLAKLHHQKSKTDLLAIVGSARRNRMLLDWAVRRLLWLKTEKKTILAALASKRSVGSEERDFAREIEAWFHDDPAEISPQEWSSVDSLMLDRTEFQALCTASRQERGEFLVALKPYTLGAIIHAAPMGE